MAELLRRISAEGIGAKVAFAWLIDPLEAEALQVLRPANLPTREVRLRREVNQRAVVCDHRELWAFEVATPCFEGVYYSEKLLLACGVVPFGNYEPSAFIC